MTCYFDLGMRNKVLSVLLAAGMVASMPAATAFNVMADDTVAAVESNDLVGDVTTTNKSSKNFTLGGISVSDLKDTTGKKIGTVATIALTKKSTSALKGDVTITVNKYDDGTATTATAKYADGADAGTVNPAEIDINVTKAAKCEEAGAATVSGSFVYDDTAWNIPDTAATIAALGHNYEKLNGTWTWTRTDEKEDNGAYKFTASYTYYCNNDKSHTVTVPGVVVDSEGVTPAGCASDGLERYTAYVVIDGETYYYNGGKLTPVTIDKNKKTYTYGVADTVLPANKLDKQPVQKTTTSTDSVFKAASTNDEKANFYFTYPIDALGHVWNYSSAEWTWNENKDTTGAKDYYDIPKDKDNKDVTDTSKWTYNYLKNAAYMNTWGNADHYLYAKSVNSTDTSTAEVEKLLDTTRAATATPFVKGLDDVRSSKDTLDNWNKLVYVKLTCSNKNHLGGQYATDDGPATVYVPAYVVATPTKAGCTTDAKVTYNAYVFYNADSAKKIGGDDAVEFYNTFQVGSDNKSYADAYGKDFVSTKVDTWEGSATGHNYIVTNWTWSNDFSYVTLNLFCTKDHSFVTVQSSKITKNADGTAKVVYTAKDARKNTNTWYGDGKDYKGYYLDQNLNPYGREYTINALPLKNAGKVNNGTIVMTRLYNKTTGEHLYTSDANEITTLVNEYNWTNEGTAWNAPAVSNTPVYRMFNRVTGEHVYTKDLNEVNTLSKKDEWNNEGIAWYSDDNKTVPVYRQFNPKAATSKASHNYTTSTNEKKTLTSQYGWNDEGIGWYGV